jgi:hypothetical protein
MARMMRFIRKVMAFMIALSVATLPVAGSASSIVRSSGGAQVTQSILVSSMSASMDGCCPDQTAPCDLPSDQCPSMASCALLSVSLADVGSAGLKYPPLPKKPVLALADQAVDLHSDSPPFRPPRV